MLPKWHAFLSFFVIHVTYSKLLIDAFMDIHAVLIFRCFFVLSLLYLSLSLLFGWYGISCNVFVSPFSFLSFCPPVLTTNYLLYTFFFFFLLV